MKPDAAKAHFVILDSLLHLSSHRANRTFRYVKPGNTGEVAEEIEEQKGF